MNFDINAYMRLSITDMIIVCISTLLIVLIAKKYFWDKVQGYLNARSQAIQSDIDFGVQQRQEGETYKSQYQEKMTNAKKEAQSIIDLAQTTAREEKRDILMQAQQEAQQIKQKAFEEMEREKLQMQKDMKNAIINVAFEAATSIVEKELDESQHKKYVDEFIESAGEQTWQA